MHRGFYRRDVCYDKGFDGRRLPLQEEAFRLAAENGHASGVCSPDQIAVAAATATKALALLVAKKPRRRMIPATVIISGYSLGRSETLKKFHSHVLPLSGEKA